MVHLPVVRRVWVEWENTTPSSLHRSTRVATGGDANTYTRVFDFEGANQKPHLVRGKSTNCRPRGLAVGNNGHELFDPPREFAPLRLELGGLLFWCDQPRRKRWSDGDGKTRIGRRRWQRWRRRGRSRWSADTGRRSDGPKCWRFGRGDRHSQLPHLQGVFPEGDEVCVPPMSEPSVLELLELFLEDTVAAVGVLEYETALAVDVRSRWLRIRSRRNSVVLRQRTCQQQT